MENFETATYEENQEGQGGEEEQQQQYMENSEVVEQQSYQQQSFGSDRPPTQLELARQAEVDTVMEELSRLDENFPICQKLLCMEMYRIKGGVPEIIDASNVNKKSRVRARVGIPEFPGINTVGKLLGKGGGNLKKMQEETQTKLAVLGSGSMRDFNKEQEALMSGDVKFQHLRLPLHLQIDCMAAPEEAFYRVSHAVAEAKKLIIPSPEEMAAMQGGGGGYGAPSAGMMPPGFAPRGGRGGGRGPFGGARGGGGPGRGRGRGGPPVSGGFDTNGFGQAYGQDMAGGKAPRGRGGPPRGGRGGAPYGRGGGRGGPPQY